MGHMTGVSTFYGYEAGVPNDSNEYRFVYETVGVVSNYYLNSVPVSLGSLYTKFGKEFIDEEIKYMECF